MIRVDEATGVTTRSVELDGETITAGSLVAVAQVVGLQSFTPGVWQGQQLPDGARLAAVSCDGDRAFAFVTPEHLAPALGQTVELEIRWTSAT